MKLANKQSQNQILTVEKVVGRPRKIRLLKANEGSDKGLPYYRLFFLFALSAHEKAQLPAGVMEDFEQSVQHSNFRGLLNQSILLSHSKAIILGLGPKNKWNLDNVCAAILSAKGIFRQLRSCILQVSLDHQPFFLDLHEGKANQSSGISRRDTELVAKPVLTVANSVVDGGGARAADEQCPECPVEFRDYGESFANMIAQIVVSLELAVDNMDFLKTGSKGKQEAEATADSSKESAEENAEENAEEKAVPLAVQIQIPRTFGQSLPQWLARADDLSATIRLSRSVAHLPGNILHPQTYQDYAERLAKQYKLKIQVLQANELKKIGMNGVLTVGQGSVNPPRVIVLRYQPAKSLTKNSKPLVLVGKGITFDTGGISLKPSQKMHEMKYDMCGSALALHAIVLAAMRELPLPVYTILALAENMPDAKAIKPGDVYQAYNGMTVENQDTDAEGRLVLADILSYAVEKNPQMLCMLDFATLTGACIVALGHEAAGLMTSSEDLAQRLSISSQKSLDRLWRLPHWSIYDRGLKSEISDIRNITDKGAGTVTAMRFLAQFVPSHLHWAHLDVAGVAWHSEKIGSQPNGPTGWGLRLLLDFMEDLVKPAASSR